VDNLQVLDHVVLNQRVASPAVDGEVAVTLGREAAAVVDGAGKMSVRATKKNIDKYCKTHRPVPGFQPLPPTKLPVFLQVTV
jgi:hypothetical protein